MKISDRKTFNIIVILLIFSIFLLYANTIPSAQSKACKVNIVGGASEMYPGQYVKLYANTSNPDIKNYTWIIEGPILKNYDDKADGAVNFSAYRNVDDSIPLSPEDFQKSSIEFYWKPQAGDVNRTISLIVNSNDGSYCKGIKNFNIEKNTNNPDLQAEDFYFDKVNEFGNRNLSSLALTEHQNWHGKYVSRAQNYSGSVFFDFHDAYINHLNNFRQEFGYSNITAWNPNTVPPAGVEFAHAAREVNSTEEGTYYPYYNSSLPEYFKIQPNGDGPVNRSITTFTNETGTYVRPCENISQPTGQSDKIQDSLNDFANNLDLLGCAITTLYHDSIHGNLGQLHIVKETTKPCPTCVHRSFAGENPGEIITYRLGDMSFTSLAPRDPIFAKFHTTINNIAKNLTKLEAINTNEDFSAMSDSQRQDTESPLISVINPGIITYGKTLEDFLISDKEKDLYGISDIPAIGILFNEPVVGVTKNSLVVNGSPAKMVYGDKSGPYVFTGFDLQNNSIVSVILRGNITDSSRNDFKETKWTYNIIDKQKDNDNDGLLDDIEINKIGTNPNSQDTDGDTLSDGYEVTSTSCLDPLESDLHLMDITGSIVVDKPFDSDRDGVNNIEEVNQGTDPCTPPLSDDDLVSGLFDDFRSFENEPFLLKMEITNILNDESNIQFNPNIYTLSYDSHSKGLLIKQFNNETVKKISSITEDQTKRIINQSGLLDEKKTLYPKSSSSNEKNYQSYTIITTLGGKTNGISWTSLSEDVPEAIRNLPYALINSFTYSPIVTQSQENPTHH